MAATVLRSFHRCERKREREEQAIFATNDRKLRKSLSEENAESDTRSSQSHPPQTYGFTHVAHTRCRENCTENKNTNQTKFD